MADTTTSRSLAPITEDAFIADRQAFWKSFTGFVLTSVISVVVILVLLAIFLL
jgi:hypothetical protein